MSIVIMGSENLNKNFSIFGDSISTFEGSNPDDYNVFYNSEMKIRTGIARETDTWWGRVIDFFDGKLLVNNSWSGSRVTKYLDAVMHPDFIMPSAPYGITLEAYNDIIRKAALKNGCYVVDIYGCSNPYDTIDGTHPNADGMKTISNNIIKEMLKSGEWNVKYRLKALFDKE